MFKHVLGLPAFWLFYEWRQANVRSKLSNLAGPDRWRFIGLPEPNTLHIPCGMHVLNLAVLAIVEALTTSGPDHWRLIRMPNTDQRRKLEEGTLAWDQVSGTVNWVSWARCSSR